MQNTTITIPFLLLTSGLVIGILLAHYFPVENTIIPIWGLAISLIILGGLKLWANKHPKKGVYFGVATCPAFITLGIFLVTVHNPLQNAQHYTRKLKIDKKSHTFLFKTQQRLKPSKNHEKYIIALSQSDSTVVQGTLLLYVSKDSANHHLEGKEFLAYSQLTSVKKPLNPNQFDYAAYLEKQGIYHQMYLDPTDLITLPKEAPKTLKEHANGARNFLIQQLEKQSLSAKTITITKAIILGQRQDIDPKTYQNYSNAGAIHILAVSGLHIGVFLWILNFLLRPLLYARHGQKLRLVIVVFLLWGYAYLTGLSPSVLRAVTMFSFIAIGQTIRFKKGSNYNALLISGFILLCFNPLILFEVGFQLSYVAVFSIFWIQPLIARYYEPRFRLDRIYWDTLTVTCAAQIGVLPLSIYYFHQVPLLFLVSNLVIVPFLGILLGLGIVMVTLAAFDKLPLLLVTVYNFLIESIDSIVTWVASKEAFLMSNIALSKIALIASYLTIASGIVLFKKFRPQRVYYFGMFLTLLSGILIVEKTLRNNQERLIIFHQYKNTLLGHHAGSQLTLLSRDSLSSKTTDYLTNPYITGQEIKIQTKKQLKNAYRYKEKQLLIIDSSGHYSSTIHPEILLLTQSPKIHLDRVIDSLQPKQIIADGSNYPSAVRRWAATCKNRKIRFYSTAVSGAFILE